MSTPSSATVRRRRDSTHPTQLPRGWLWTVRIAWAAAALTILLLFVLTLSTRYTQLLSEAAELRIALTNLHLSTSTMALYISAFDVVTFTICAGIALVIFWRKSDDWMTVFVSAILMGFGLTLVRPLDSILRVDPTLHWLFDAVRQLTRAGIVVFCYSFPNGRFVPRWTRGLAILISGAAALAALFPKSEFNFDNLDPATSLAIQTPIYLTGLGAQIYRYVRVSGPTGRQQTKWVIWGIAGALVGMVAFMLPPILFPAIERASIARLIYIWVGVPLFFFALLLVPLTIAVSILRARLWQIDFLINRSIVYGALTAALGVVFLALVLGLQQVFLAMTGGLQAPIALGASALVIGAVFQPARHALRRGVDRYLYGIQVKYRNTPRLFGGRGAQVSVGLVGTQVGAYQITEYLGRGGMSEVYKGTHSTLGRVAAIKVLPPTLASESAFRARFEREAKVVAALQHPSIVQVFDFGQTDNTYYMAMEFITGQDLAEYMQGIGPLPLDEVCSLVRDIAGALDYAHAQGLVHRDVKPSNVMLQPATTATGRQKVMAWRAVLTDFGIARVLSAETRITHTGMVGTFDYIAPEQIRDAKDVDGRADIYSLGVMAYEMLTGKLPFSAGHPGMVLIAHMQQPPPDPRDLRPDLPEEVSDVLFKAMEKDPARRWTTAGEMAAALGG